MPTSRDVSLKPAFKQAPAASVHMDTMRGLAAMAVMLSHWRALLFLSYREVAHPSIGIKTFYMFTGLGHQAVVIFFVLSGYLVGKSALRSFSEGWRWSPYLLNRFTRLWIVLIPALALGFVWDIAGSHIFRESFLYLGYGQPIISWRILDHTNWRIAIGNLLFLQTILVPVFGSNGPLWSLANEFWYYMLFPLLLLTGSRRSQPLIRIIYGMTVIGIVWLVGTSIALGFLIWLMGAALVYAPRWTPIGKNRLNAAIALALLFVLTVANAERFIPFGEDVFEMLLGFSCTLLLWLLLQSRKSAPMNFRRRCSNGLAAMSYTLYLFHLPALLFMAALLHPNVLWQPDLYHLSIGAAIAFGVFAYSVVLYFCFERNTALARNWIASDQTR
jgi:peptidoglycan/LPS O-acetylase OafA/YrhL